MIRQNLHTHTRFDDGKNTVLEMAEAALTAGLTSLGFSGHSVLPYENDWSMTNEAVPAYIAAVCKAKAVFSDRLRIYCGLEWDGISPQSTDGFDYIIGSLHHIDMGGGHYPSVDESPEATREALVHFFHGDSLAMAESYYGQYAALAANPAVDIVGHLDLITKFNEADPLFDNNAPRYRDAVMAALETLWHAGKIFEVNTGAMSRGWRTAPYPARWLLKEIRARNGRILVTSDAHSADTISHAFRETEVLLRDIGFTELWTFTEAGFIPAAL